MKRVIQKALLGAYAAVERSGLLGTPIGRRCFEAAYLAYKRSFEAGPVKELAAVVTPASTVIDVGANIGFYTTYFARWVGREGAVLAIEPEPRNIATLRRRTTRPDFANSVEILQGVAADRSGPRRLAVNPSHPGDHRLSDTGIEVEGWAIDDLMRARELPHVSLVKIDVQGAEAIVVEGAIETLRADRPALLIEIDPSAGAAMGLSVEALLAQLAELGYVGTRWGRGLARQPMTAAQIQDLAAARGYIDVLFLPD